MTICAHPCPRSDGSVLPDRRQFLSTTLALSVLGVLSACGEAGGTTGPTGPLVVTLATFPALGADGGVARVDGGTGTPTAVLRVSATSFRAFSLVCPHAGATVNIVADGFRCPNHGATFSPTGAVTGGPANSGLTERSVTLDAAAGTLTIT